MESNAKMFCPACGAERDHTLGPYCSECGQEVGPTEQPRSRVRSVWGLITSPGQWLYDQEQIQEKPDMRCTAKELESWETTNNEGQPQTEQSAILEKSMSAEETVRTHGLKTGIGLGDLAYVGYETKSGLLWDKYSIIWLSFTIVFGIATISNFAQAGIFGIGATAVSGLYANYLIKGGKFRIIFF